MRIKLRRGLDLPIPGAPQPIVERARAVRSVALLGHDHPRMRRQLRVSQGDRVDRGQTLFVDRRRPEICFTAPAAGVVTMARRDEGRESLRVVIGVDEDAAAEPAVHFTAVSLEGLRTLDGGEVARRLLEAGEWPALRTRPFGGVPDPDAEPAALFVRAIDTSPLAAPASALIERRPEDLRFGVAALARLCSGPVFVCCDRETARGLEDVADARIVCFEGPHPAGLVGTHIHHLFPAREGRAVWYTGCQEAIAIGHLFRTGRADVERVIALAGPNVRHPRLLVTRLGADTEDLVEGELSAETCRIVAGSPLSGRRAATDEHFLGRYHEQLCALPEDGPVGSASWLLPGPLGARRVPFWRRRRRWTTSLHGSPRAMLPLAAFDDASPLRLPLALLLRALAAGDFESAREFGALELEEEDLALCSFLCPAKLEYGELLHAAHDALGAVLR